MTIIVDIDGLTGETEYTHKGEIKILDLPSFITWSKPDDNDIPTDAES